MPYLKFTGKRTGLVRASVLGKGSFEKGDLVEVSDEEAARWLAVIGEDDKGRALVDWEEASDAEIKKHLKAEDKAAEAAEEAATVEPAPPAPESASSVKE